MLARAIEVAKRSPVRKHKVGAVITDRKGKEISIGWAHPSHLKHVSTPYSMHAELHAILRADRKALRGATIYVACIAAKSGNITRAKPCTACAAVIKAAGIGNIVYTERRKV